nr:MAG TPA: hypothetical protein [Caudoviricetes sp.]
MILSFAICFVLKFALTISVLYAKTCANKALQIVTIRSIVFISFLQKFI